MFLQSQIKSECCGCRACAEICEKNAILMKADDDGFFYPEINADKCVDCGNCIKACPMDKPIINYPQKAYVGTHTKNSIFKKSASGGAFFAISEKLIQNNYTIFGAYYDEDNNVLTDCADSIENCGKFQKSKYVLSNTNGCFKKIRKLLSEDKNVCFSGTPCQTAALKAFLKKDYKNLICIDIVCHGAPNQEIFDSEINYLENKYKDEVLLYEFRNKRPINNAVNTRSAYVKFKSGREKLLRIDDDPFLTGYYLRLFYRPSCGSCPFATPMRNSDITLADAWGVEEIYSDLNAIFGVSLLLSNTKNGDEIIKTLDNMNLRDVSVQWAIEANEQLRKPTDLHNNRDIFFKNRSNMKFETNIKKCTQQSITQRCIGKAKHIMNKFFR